MNSRERYEHTHTPEGYFLHLGTVQDAIEPSNCATCGRTTNEPWNHAFDCPSYRPHGSSIAGRRLAQAEQAGAE